MTNVRNTAIHGLGKIYIFLMLQKMVHILTTGLQKVIFWNLFVHSHPESFIFLLLSIECKFYFIWVWNFFSGLRIVTWIESTWAERQERKPTWGRKYTSWVIFDKKINKDASWSQKNPIKGFTLKHRRKYLRNIDTDHKEKICKVVDWIKLFRETEHSWDLASFGSIKDGEMFVN
jgi:hypothetical protein